jgi:hypothetical protein
VATALDTNRRPNIHEAWIATDGACSRRRGNDARPRLRGVAGPRRHGLSGAGTTRSTSHRLILQSVVHSRGATSRRNTHPESPLLESRRVCERKGPGSTGALSVGSPSFVGEMVAEGWRELPRVRLDGPLRRAGQFSLRPVGELMPGPVGFHAKRFCRTVDLARLDGEIRNVARVQRGERTPLSRVAPAMAAARQPLAPRLAPGRGASSYANTAQRRAWARRRAMTRPAKGCPRPGRARRRSGSTSTP